MLQPVVGRAFLISLWICSCLLLSTAVGVLQPVEQSALPPLKRSSGEYSAACWAPIPSRLILPW